MIVPAQSEPSLSIPGTPLVSPVAPVPDTIAAEAAFAAAASNKLEGWWTLRYGGWTLLTPRGGRLDLSELERACFLCLLRNPRRELLRSELVAMRQHTKMRTLNVAICRLRRKVGEAGDRLPLHTVHGIGYVFLGKLREFVEP